MVNSKTISTDERFKLAGHVVRRVSFNLNFVERELTRRVSDYLTGSNMWNEQFEPESIKYDEIERQKVLGIIDGLYEVVTDPEMPYSTEIIDEWRVNKLRSIIAALDESFDEAECKRRIIERLNQGHWSVRVDDEYGQQGVDAYVAYLTHSEGHGTAWFNVKVDRTLEAGDSLSDVQVNQLYAVLAVLKRSYPSALVADRQEKLEQAITLSNQRNMFVSA